MDALSLVEMQLSELELLESIYPNKDEVVVEDLMLLSVMKKYLQTNGQSIKPQKMLPVSLNLSLLKPSCSLVIKSVLPKEYPDSVLPEVFLRCDQMAREAQLKFNADLNVHMQSFPLGETCLYQVAQWAVDNAHRFVQDLKAETRPEEKEIPKTTIFTRLWIYSHHIYNKDKRKCILEWAKELNLSGFSMPGKPGVVCVEGPQDHCEDYWQRLKRLSWKHIEVRHREICDPEGSNFSDMNEISFEVHGHRNNHMDMGAFYTYLTEHRLRRQTWKRLTIAHREDQDAAANDIEVFPKFQLPFMEKDFGVHGGRDYHMDLGKFLQFLREHDCENVFSILFGVQGTLISND